MANRSRRFTASRCAPSSPGGKARTRSSGSPPCACSDREFDGFWVDDGLSLSDQTGRARLGGRSEGHGAADRAGRQVAHHATADGASLPPGKIDVAGFAWAGEPDIARVEVSTDHGATWQPARLVGEQAEVRVATLRVHVRREPPESYLILSRATDSNGRTQPMSPPWNPSGYLWNAPDSVRVEVKA